MLSFYIWDSNYLSDIQFENIFSHSIGCLSFFWLFLLICKNFLIRCSSLVVFAFVAFDFGVRSKNSLPRSMSRSFLPIFFSRNFKQNSSRKVDTVTLMLLKSKCKYLLEETSFIPFSKISNSSPWFTEHFRQKSHHNWEPTRTTCNRNRSKVFGYWHF